MARPIKEGLDYFPLDVDFHNDEKIEVIAGEFGVKGEAIAIRLLCAIYRQGYFIQWSEALKYKLAKRTNLSSNLIEDVVTRLVKWDFFDKALFDSSQVLTSRGIQKRYKQITKKRKFLPGEYWLLEFPHQKSAETIVNDAETKVNGEKTTQSKVKESKVKERKGKKKPPQPKIGIFDISNFSTPTTEEPLAIPDDQIESDLTEEAFYRITRRDPATECINVREKSALEDMAMSGVTISDLETAFTKTVNRGEPKTNALYLSKLARDAKAKRLIQKQEGSILENNPFV